MTDCHFDLSHKIASIEINSEDLDGAFGVMLLMKISSMTMVSQFWVTAVTEKGEGRSSQVSFRFSAFFLLFFVLF